jgi:NAD(P)H dehydrogenase (quinone)
LIIITGATGKLGRQIVEQLLARVPASGVGVSVRDVDKAQDLADRGVRVRAGSFTEPESLAYAFEGASQVLIVSVDKLGDEAVDMHRAAIDAAVMAGAQRIVYTSHAGARHDSHFQACRDHAATEDALSASGAAFTALRNGFYAATVGQFLGQALGSGQIVLPTDGPVSWTDYTDLAEVAAVILADEGRFDGPTPPLTGARSYTYDDVAALASELTGRPFTRTTVSDEQFRQQLVGHGVPVEAADLMLSIFAASRDEEFAAVDPTLAELIGREPLDLADVLRPTLSPAALSTSRAHR